MPPANDGETRRENHMRKRYATAAVIGVAAVLAMLTGAAAFDETKYPDWGGQWKRPRGAIAPRKLPLAAGNWVPACVATTRLE